MAALFSFILSVMSGAGTSGTRRSIDMKGHIPAFHILKWDQTEFVIISNINRIQFRELHFLLRSSHTKVFKHN